MRGGMRPSGAVRVLSFIIGFMAGPYIMKAIKAFIILIRQMGGNP